MTLIVSDIKLLIFEKCSNFTSFCPFCFADKLKNSLAWYGGCEFPIWLTDKQFTIAAAGWIIAITNKGTALPR